MAVALALAAAAVLASLPWASGQVSPDVQFTVSVTDSDTSPMAIPFYDVQEIALGEPGDGSVVFRGTMADAPAANSNGVFYFGFTTDAGDVVGGCDFAGGPQTRNIGEAIAPDACFVDGAAFYATYSYGTIEAAVGAAITQIWGFSDMCDPAGDCLPGDTAPGNLVDEWPSTTFGTDYTLSGCTLTANCPAAGNATNATAPVYSNLTSPTLSQSFNRATNGTYVFNFTSDLGHADLAVNATGAGNVTVVALHAGSEAFNETLQAPANRTKEVADASGTWQYQVRYENFTGGLSVTLAEHPEPVSSSTSTSNDDTRSGTFPLRKDDKGTPALGLPLLLAATAAAALARRRLA
jgi:hypothetical protein